MGLNYLRGPKMMFWASGYNKAQNGLHSFQTARPNKVGDFNKLKTQNSLNNFQTARPDKVWASKIEVRPRMAFVF